MGGTFQFYLDAAKALWEAPIARLEQLSATGDPEALRRAAGDALMMKAEFMTPDGVGDERKAIAILAAGLQDDPEFTLDVAVRLSGSHTPRRASNSRSTQHLEPATASPSSRRRTVLVTVAVAIAALLALEVLATAGAAVPNPIGDVIDELTDDEPEAVAPAESQGEISPEWHPNIVYSGVADLSLPRRTMTVIASTTVTKPKNPKWANGRSRNDPATKKKKTKPTNRRPAAKSEKRKQRVIRRIVATAKVRGATATHAAKPGVRQSNPRSQAARNQKRAPRKTKR